MALPCFVGIAALAPELCRVMFGANGDSASAVLRPLAMLGALQCVEYFNGTCFNALGMPSKTMTVSIIKTAIGLAAIFLCPATDTEQLVRYFVYSQMLAMPICYGFVVVYARVSLWQLARRLLPFAVAALLMFHGMESLRAWPALASLAAFPRLIALGALGAVLYLMVAGALGRTYLAEVVGLFVARRSARHGQSP